jgi:hypothetical protein
MSPAGGRKNFEQEDAEGNGEKWESGWSEFGRNAVGYSFFILFNLLYDPLGKWQHA